MVGSGCTLPGTEFYTWGLYSAQFAWEIFASSSLKTPQESAQEMGQDKHGWEDMGNVGTTALDALQRNI